MSNLTDTSSFTATKTYYLLGIIPVWSTKTKENAKQLVIQPSTMGTGFNKPPKEADEYDTQTGQKK